MSSDAPSLRESQVLSLNDALTLVVANHRGLALRSETVRMADDLVRRAARQIAQRLEQGR